jgi:phage nucleotide-binding protein
MAIQLKNTNDVHTSGVKMVVYGAAGAGKTTLATTMPKPIIISAEGGLLSINGSGIPYVEVKTMEELTEVYNWVSTSSEAAEFESVILDSISEIGEVVLEHEKKVNKDGRAAYGEMAVQMTSLIRAFRDLSGKHVLMTAKLDKSQDEMGRMLYSPSMPGAKMSQQLPYFFDIVAALRVEKDAEGVAQRALMCDTDGLWTAKSRLIGVDSWEPADLGAIIKKVGGQS